MIGAAVTGRREEEEERSARIEIGTGIGVDGSMDDDGVVLIPFV